MKNIEFNQNRRPNKQGTNRNKIDGNASSRRSFLKKAAYSAPMLITMGQLIKPTAGHADTGCVDGPPGLNGC